MKRMSISRRDLLLAAGGLQLLPASLRASTPADAIEKKTFVYATRGERELLLDLYLPPERTAPLPLIVFVHGGGWFAGTRVTGPDFRRYFAIEGFAMASIEYGLVPTIAFPANVEDVKTAIRWLRANATANGLNPERFGLWGTSSGGQLAAIAALAAPGMYEGEGIAGRSSAVQCVLDAYGPTDFLVMDAQAE